MGERIQKLKRIKKIRIHHEGTDTLVYSAFAIIAIAVVLWQVDSSRISFWIFAAIFGTVWAVVLNFFRCPIRKFPSEETENIVVAPADGRIVVIEEVVSIFMSLFNVHANWFPVDRQVLKAEHFNGNFHKAWLPKAAAENEHADILIKATNGQTVLCRQIAGAMARRIVTYAKTNDDCYIDEHLGFIKFGSRVDLFLPLGTEICVKMGQATTGDLTVIGKLKPAEY